MENKTGKSFQNSEWKTAFKFVITMISDYMHLKKKKFFLHKLWRKIMIQVENGSQNFLSTTLSMISNWYCTSWIWRSHWNWWKNIGIFLQQAQCFKGSAVLCQFTRFPSPRSFVIPLPCYLYSSLTPWWSSFCWKYH